MERMPIRRLNDEPATRFAARELKRYLAHMTSASYVVRPDKAYDPDQRGIWLGLFGDVGVEPARGADSALDDQIHIEMGPEGGVIAGPNPRSILLAVYRYLTELGCRWVRPGRRGEYVPELGGPLPEVHVREKASYRHRGVCIEGAVGWQHVRDMVDWLPKVGLNAYYIQFREGYNFFQRWYEHEWNPRMPRREFRHDEARDLTRALRAQVKKRGLVLHMVGHGWTCEPFGIPGTGWFQHQGPLPVEAVPHLAEIDGERKLWGGIALNTNLCYGNPETRAIITDAIVHYAQENPDVDIIHFWLADGSNNQCECPLCRKHRPSDLYVKMLNELGAKLDEAGLPVRIVFLAYVDLLWPPQKERIANPDRLILMFAPITRSYSTPFTAARDRPPELTPFRRNRLQFPSDPGHNLAFLEAWQQQFPGEGFDFDYHFMWDHYKDPAQYAMAKVLHADIRGLKQIGLDGFMSCQVQRAFFPTGLGMTVMARTLWNRNLSFKAIASDYFAAVFGDQAGAVQGYLASLSALFEPRVLRGEARSDEVGKAVTKWRRIPGVVDAMQAAIRDGIASNEGCRRRSWTLLRHHGELCRLLSAALIERHAGGQTEAHQAARKVVEWARRTERYLHPELDLYEFLTTIGPVLGLSREELAGSA